MNMYINSLGFAVPGDIAQDDLTNSVTEGTENTIDGMNLPPGVDELLSGLPEINEGEEMFREKCSKNGVNGSYEAAMVNVLSVKLIFLWLVKYYHTMLWTR